MTLQFAIMRRCAGVLDWYHGCTVCPETLSNLNRDLSSVINEAVKDVGAKPLPYVLRAKFDGAEIVVSIVPWTES